MVISGLCVNSRLFRGLTFVLCVVTMVSGSIDDFFVSDGGQACCA